MATEGLGFGLEITELRLGLPGSSGNEKKRVFSEIVGENRQGGDNEDCEKAMVAKSQVVGWPPVRAYRMKSFDKERMKNICSVKVSMDGAICLRKIDLAMQKGYNGLVVALEKLFGCYGIGEGLKDESSESGEYKLIYEDKDGDWMLVGDVPWEMFTETCKRLRIMKKSEAKEIGGLLKERDFLKSGASFGDNDD